MGLKLCASHVGVSRELGSTFSTGKMRAKQRPCFEQSMSLNFKGEAVQELFDPGSKRPAIEMITSHKTWILKYAVYLIAGIILLKIFSALLN